MAKETIMQSLFIMAETTTIYLGGKDEFGQ